MMFIELHKKSFFGKKHVPFLVDVSSGWEVVDEGDDPAVWINNSEGRNLCSSDSYASVKRKLIESGQLVPVPVSDKYPESEFPTLAHVLDFWISEKARQNEWLFFSDGVRAPELQANSLLIFIRDNADELREILSR